MRLGTSTHSYQRILTTIVRLTTVQATDLEIKVLMFRCTMKDLASCIQVLAIICKHMRG